VIRLSILDNSSLMLLSWCVFTSGPTITNSTVLTVRLGYIQMLHLNYI